MHKNTFIRVRACAHCAIINKIDAAAVAAAGGGKHTQRKKAKTMKKKTPYSYTLILPHICRSVN